MTLLRFAVIVFLAAGSLLAVIACSSHSDFQAGPLPLFSQTTVAQPVNAASKTKPEGGRSIYVIGSVNNPGWVVVPSDKPLTLANAVKQAGGPTPRASRYVTITRIMPDGTTKTFEDVDLLLAWKGTGPDFPLEDGDTVAIPEAIFTGIFR